MRRSAAVVALLVCPHAVAGEESHFETGIAAYQARDYGKAVAELETYLKSRRAPEPLVMWALGASHLRLKNVDAARLAFARLYDLRPEGAQARVVTARFLIREQLEELAQKELERARELDNHAPQLHHLLGEIALSRNDADTAVAEFRIELSTNPAFWMTHYLLGQALTRKENWKAAVGPLQKAIWLNPDFSSPYLLLGRVYMRLDDNASAEGMLKRAVDMDPNNANARFQLGTLYKKMGRPAEAAAQFELYKALRK
jgi:tetratricopeptide (TPR) repeat protein